MGKPVKIEAICELVGGSVSMDGDVVIYDQNQTPPSESDVNTKLAEMTSEWTANEYARKRKAEYPDWGTQLNKIYDDGITKWKAEMVDPIKAKYPKP